MWANLFTSDALPISSITGTYNLKLVFLSYLVATGASYIALDITSRLRDIGNTRQTYFAWLAGGAIAMGCGIWSMHFIGMLAFNMSVPMAFDPWLTGISLLVAILASSFALNLLGKKTNTILRLFFGGIILGLSISAMHYIGMSAMSTNMTIHYVPSIFFISILVGVLASEAALLFAIKSSNEGVFKTRLKLKLLSALIMGIAICGMHYTGMAAAVFSQYCADSGVTHLDPEILSINIAIVTFLILGIAFLASSYKEILNYQTVKMARQAGMAEVAASVLHNVGNVLNSLNTSVALINDHISKSELSSLTDVNKLLQQHKVDLGTFVTTDPAGSNLPNYINDISEYWQREKTLLLEELQRLNKQIKHINSVISMQQGFSKKSSNVTQLVSLSDVTEEAISLAAVNFERHQITLEKNYNDVVNLYTDKEKIIQILVNFIHNAVDSLDTVKNQSKIIIISIIKSSKNKINIEIKDNGQGISQENLGKLFFHGFTTKADGHGFGLHSSALAAKSIGAEIIVSSEGLNKGATFILQFTHENL